MRWWKDSSYRTLSEAPPTSHTTALGTYSDLGRFQQTDRCTAKGWKSLPELEALRVDRGGVKEEIGSQTTSAIHRLGELRKTLRIWQ